jgi:maltooligosyltrehalose trehalohydrolase
LIVLRRQHIEPRLAGTRSLGAEAVGPAAVIARWHLGDGAVLTIAVNLAAERVVIPAYRFRLAGVSIHGSRQVAPGDSEDCLPGYTTWVLLEAAP